VSLPNFVKNLAQIRVMSKAATNTSEGKVSLNSLEVEAAVDDEDSSSEPDRPEINHAILFVMGGASLIEHMNTTLLLPYINPMVCEFVHGKSTDAKVQTTIGMLIAAYSLCFVVFNPFWSYLANRFGRKPVLLIGLASSVVLPVIFGCSSCLEMAFFARGLDGAFCGNMGVIRAMLDEMVDETTESKAFNSVAGYSGIAMIAGPLIGGHLVRPVHYAPELLADGVLDRYPYLAPNLVYSFFALLVFSRACVVLPETLPRDFRRDCCNFRARSKPHPWSSTLKKTVLAQCVRVGSAASLAQMFVVVVSIPVDRGGFGLGPQEIGTIQSVSAVGLIFTHFFIGPYLSHNYGGFFSCMTGFIVYISIYAIFPLYGGFFNQALLGAWRYLPLLILRLISSSGSALFSLYGFINHASANYDASSVDAWVQILCQLTKGVCSILTGVLSSSFGEKQDSSAYSQYFGIHVIVLISVLAMWFASSGLRQAAHFQRRSFHPHHCEH